MMDVLIKYPTRARPDLFRRVLNLYLADPLARVLVSADLDDVTMNNPGMRDWLTRDRVKVRWGNSRTKVEAINDGVADEPFDLLILAADDMIPQYPDYAARIVNLFNRYFPSGDGVLHLNDGRTGAKLNTLCILDRKYFDRTGTIYHRDYTSVFCDDEFQAVSEQLGRAVYVDEVIIRHDWIGHTPDALHARNESFYERDREIFERRRATMFA